MTTPDDPFRHHPDWRDRIADPLQSRFRTMDTEMLDKRMSALQPGHWRTTDEQREQSRLEILAGRLDDDIWVYGCGSLIWDPGFLFTEVRLGRTTGFHRRFCLQSELGRGAPGNPGLMVGFDVGGSAQSVAFRIPQEHLHHETRLLWRREMLLGGYCPQFVPLETAQGNIEALAFVVNQESPGYQAQIDTDRAARMVAKAAGVYGPNIEYLEALINQLAAFGIDDPHCSQLYDLASRYARENSNDNN